MFVDLSLKFGSLGTPEAFHAEAGGDFHGKLFVEVENPTIPAANGMGNWHAMTPRLDVGTFTFFVGPVPVVVSVAAQLNGMASVDRDVIATVSMGAWCALFDRDLCVSAAIGSHACSLETLPCV